MLGMWEHLLILNFNYTTVQIPADTRFSALQLCDN